LAIVEAMGTSARAPTVGVVTLSITFHIGERKHEREENVTRAGEP
jgi:hypothetical protein